MILTVFDVFKLNQTIEHLNEQGIKLSFKNGYELLKFKKELDNIEQYTAQRLNSVIDSERMSKNEMTEEEQMVYVTVMSNEVDINKPEIDFDEIKNSRDINLSLSDIETLCTIFEEKNLSSTE